MPEYRHLVFLFALLLLDCTFADDVDVKLETKIGSSFTSIKVDTNLTKSVSTQP